MTDRDPDRPIRADPDNVDREPVVERDDPPAVRIDDRGGFRDTAPNPHDEEGAPKTAAQTTGAFMLAGAMWPAVILAIIALALILYFVFR